MVESRKHPAIIKAIKHAGNASKLALLVKTTRQNISNLLLYKRQITPFMASRIEIATKGAVSKKELLPTFKWD